MYNTCGMKNTAFHRVVAIVALALGAYAASGSDSFYLVLREIANSGEVARVDTEIAMRGCVGALLNRLYPPP